MKKFFGLIALMVWTTFLFAQDQTVKGKVISKTDGQPIPGVSVSIKGTTTGTITNIDGEYTLPVTQGAKLQFSFIGMKSQEVAVSGGSVDVTMVDEVSDLTEVVVVGYGVQKKSLVTGAIAKVNGAELTKSSDARVTEAMQGKTAGVVIASNSGQPGSGVSVRVRGTGTNGDTAPLYIIDGLPSSEAATDILNSSDVESIEVLKDAASAAIYGARGANGVVIITTKGGKKDTKLTVAYDGYYGVQNAWKKLPLCNSKEYMMLVDESRVNGGDSPFFTDAYKASHEIADTDWQDEMFNKNAVKQSHSISMNGGSDKINYSSSLNYFNQDGIIAKGKSNLEKYSYRIATDVNFGFLRIGSNLTLGHITSRGIDTNTLFGAGMNQAANMPPVIPVTMADGSWGTSEKYSGMTLGEITNPVALLNYRNSKTRTNKVMGGLSATLDFGHVYAPLKGLTFKTSYSGEYAMVNNDSYTPEYYVDSNPGHFNDTGDMAYKSFEQYTSWNLENVLAYDKTIDTHHINVMVGQSAFENTYENLNGSKKKLIFKDFEHSYLDNATDLKSATANGGFSDHTVASLFGRVNYDLNSKYMLSGTIRRDGSSRFGSNNKFGIFPSASIGWVISNEEFMQGNEDILDMLKLRASWGQNGNENIGDFRYTSVMSNNKYYYFGDVKTQVNGAIPSRIANPDLKWETSEQINFGIDYVGISGKLRTNLDYYVKNTIDWLVDAPITATVGNYAPTVNGGSVRNSGVEFEIAWKDKVAMITYGVSINGAVNKNKVIDIKNTEKRLQGGQGAFQQNDILIAKVGEPIGSFYGLKTDGIFQNQAQIDAYVNSSGAKIQPNAKPGDFKFVDADGNGVIESSKDRVILGSPMPKFTGGMNLSLEAYGFDFNAFLYTALGQKIWDATRRYDRNFANYRADWLNRWTGEGTSNEYPRLTTNDANYNMNTPSDFYVKDGSYLRLKTVTLGYTLPKTVTQALKVNRVRLYVSGENMLTITGYKGFDPEIGGGVFGNGIDQGVYPQARTILGGVNVTF